VPDSALRPGVRYEAIIKLIEERAQYDLGNSEAAFTEARAAAETLKQNDSAWFVGLRRGRADSKQSELERVVSAKRRWAQTWADQAWAKLAEQGLAGLRTESISDLKRRYDEDDERSFQKFLIVQEAVLAPMYLDAGAKEPSFREIDPKGGRSLAGRSFGMDSRTGEAIYDGVTDFLKRIGDFWGRIFKWAVVGAVAAAIVVSGGALLLGGAASAAAITGGLAFVGGGAVTAGGLGMAGGLAVLVTSSTLLGLGGAGVAAMLMKMPQEAIAVTMAKVCNYVAYLSGEVGKGRNPNTARKLRDQVVKQALTLKHAAEVQTLEDAHADLAKALAPIRILNVAYEKLFEAANGTWKL
jgi:hypothetical protein